MQFKEGDDQASPSLWSLAQDIKVWAKEVGFLQAGISRIHPPQAEERLLVWLSKNHHGQMEYMAHHGLKRSRPDLLIPGVIRVISVNMPYLTASLTCARQILSDPEHAYISRYALGRDYHKVLRQRLKILAGRIAEQHPASILRVFTDSAPVLEKPLAEQAGLGWIGKHTNLIHQRSGSWFFLGEIYTDLPLPADQAASNHCGVCRKCLDTCPTQALIAPYQLDARRCIAYLTIELHGPIPIELRPLIGNRIYGCDDCQLICPWSRFAQLTQKQDFFPRNNLDTARLLELFKWNEGEFLHYTEGSAIRRLGHRRWLRNLAVALGNGPACQEVIRQLQARMLHPDEMVKEHVCWALNALQKKKSL